jgi:hypothetical protein
MICITGCKSKKKAMEAEKARMEQEAALKKKQEEEAAAAKRAAEENARLEAEAREREARELANAPTNKLNNYFDAIANAGSAASANSSINEALGMFSSAETPVLIVISEEDGKKDYDEPTNIKKYLEYLKDQKKNMNKISNLQFDSAGKITEVELTKN